MVGIFWYQVKEEKGDATICARTYWISRLISLLPFYLLSFSFSFPSLFISLFTDILVTLLSATVPYSKGSKRLPTQRRARTQVSHSPLHSLTVSLPSLGILNYGPPRSHRRTWRFGIRSTEYPFLHFQWVNTRRKREIRHRPRLSFRRSCRLFPLVCLPLPHHSS